MQGVHKESGPLIGRTLCRLSDWMNELKRSDESVSTCNCGGVSGIMGHVCMGEGWLIWCQFEMTMTQMLYK